MNEESWHRGLAPYAIAFVIGAACGVLTMHFAASIHADRTEVRR